MKEDWAGAEAASEAAMALAPYVVSRQKMPARAIVNVGGEYTLVPRQHRREDLKNDTEVPDPFVSLGDIDVNHQFSSKKFGGFESFV